MTDPNILSFYGWWQLSVCLFAFAGLMAIWWHIGRKQNDFGQVWLALSILCWSFSGLVEVIYSQAVEGDLGRVYLDGWRSIFSLLNSLFILLALPWFRYIPERIAAIIQSDYWRIIVGLPFLFCLLPTLRKLFTGKDNTLISELDVYYAFFTLLFLAYVLWESFWRRRLKSLAYLSILAILLTVIAQIYKLSSANVNLLLFSAIFKTNLIMIFFALALSWVKELSELRLLLNASQIFIRFDASAPPASKSPVWIKGINKEVFQKILLTRKKYELLYSFAAKKKASPKEGWLTIKPQGEKRTAKVYDIQEHKEYLRIVETLLDATYGKSNWTKDLHEKPLIDALFSKPGNRKIRLAIPAENIEIG